MPLYSLQAKSHSSCSRSSTPRASDNKALHLGSSFPFRVARWLEACPALRGLAWKPKRSRELKDIAWACLGISAPASHIKQFLLRFEDRFSKTHRLGKHTSTKNRICQTRQMTASSQNHSWLCKIGVCRRTAKPSKSCSYVSGGAPLQDQSPTATSAC